MPAEKAELIPARRLELEPPIIHAIFGYSPNSCQAKTSKFGLFLRLLLAGFPACYDEIPYRGGQF
jgi:hypothetical protein